MLFIFTIHGVAQSDDSKFLPNITPPSPTAGELGKYGNVPVGLFTGAANISVPLINFKTKDLESPMSLYYGSNGIKVDEVASNVGLGWNLNFGGVITRTVRDKSDDLQTMVYPPDNFYNASNAEKVAFYKAAGQDNADTEKDLYSFNFNGNSGKFIYDKNNVPILTNHQKIKIERITNNTDFLLTTTNGVKYYFTEKETTAFRSQGEGHSVVNASVTAWYLTKIVHPNGAEIYLSYEKMNMDYTASNSQTLKMSYPAMQNSCNATTPYTSGLALSGIVAYNMKVIGKRINKISSNNIIDGYVTFVYTASGINEEVDGNGKIETITQYNGSGTLIEKIKFNYLKTTNARVFLQNITFNNPSKNYVFEYINQTSFPKRLATSQDHWGYYNGKDYNTNLVPKNINDYDIGLNNMEYNGADKEPNADFAKIGLLKKIFYPTKGYTEFDYESNTYWGEKTTYPVKTNVRKVRSYTDTDKEDKTYTITSPIDQKISFIGSVKYVSPQAPRYDPYGNLIPDPGNTGHFTASIAISCADPQENCPRFYQETQFGTPYYHDSGGFIFINSMPEQIVDNEFYFDAKAGKTYTLSFYKNGNRVSAMVDYTYYATTPDAISTNIETGGVRIKSTADFAEASAKANYKRYYYGNKDNLNKSSGDKGKTPLYVDIELLRTLCGNDGGGLSLGTSFVDNSNLVVSSSSIISLFDTGSSNCFYKYVTISEGGDDFENGGEMKEFIVHRDNWVDNLDSKGQPIIVDNEINGRSKILGTVDIKSAPLTNFGWDNGLERRSEVLQKKNAGVPFVVVAETENKYKLDLSYKNEVKGYNVRKYFNDLFSIVGSVDYLSIVEYATKSHWFYLESSISKKFDINGLNPIETTIKYEYSNPIHLQLTSQSTTNSKAEILETKYFYPQDSQMANEPFVKELIVQNRIETALDVQTFRRGIKLSEQKTVYDKSIITSNLLLPSYILENKGTAALNPVTDKKISYDFYDDKGNLLQYTQDGGTPTSIVWGYDKTLPIAKLDNIAYKSIPISLITEVQNASSYIGTDASMLTAINKFTYNYSGLSNTKITSYMYKPLIGVTRITDAQELNTYYDYDEFNRLKFIKDKDLNVLQAYFYNYKGQFMDISLEAAPIYYNIAMSKTFYKAICPLGQIGTYEYPVSAGMFTSVISQADADAKALAFLDYEGQKYVDYAINCNYKNAEKSAFFTKNNCKIGIMADPTRYTVPARKYSSQISQAEADKLAQADIDKNGQAYANANGSCIYKSNELSGYLNMFSEYLGMVKVAYLVPAGEFSSAISQDDADNQAQEGLSQCWQEFSCKAEQYQEFAPNIPPIKLPEYVGYDCKNVVFTIMQPSYETN
ncbi:hypothetical protein B0A62_13750 [Flavobacterium hydatis]|uniref:DUF5977 domain-containing protein n=1 Tax=Flavobacterium hydatis TaxID=991 RepID=A0A086A045_FLAHY|nr:hypothetical protein IW20_21540 [Flavobacterium hydatis]OXA93306.1 hypothetical protein B0A62_13750 [Flavobacterium hydatis]